MDRDFMRDSPTLQQLQITSLLKFYCTSNMRAQVCLVEDLVTYRDHEIGVFDLQGETLELAIDYIYFIMGLSCRGTPVNLEGTGRGGDPLSV